MTDRRPIKIIGDLAFVPLGGGEAVSVIDAADVELVDNREWYRLNRGYAVSDDDGCKSKLLLHRLINNTPLGFETDHINGNKLDNRRCNLRTATKSQNQANRKSAGMSRWKGVHQNKHGSWVAQIRRDGVQRYLGSFAEEADAAMAYNEAAYEIHGRFCRLNNHEDNQV